MFVRLIKAEGATTLRATTAADLSMVDRRPDLEGKAECTLLLALLRHSISRL
jgi:hypothetical protein